MECQRNGYYGLTIERTRRVPDGLNGTGTARVEVSAARERGLVTSAG